MKLIQQLQYTTATREHRGKAAQWVLSHPDTFTELLNLCLKNDPEISHKANWVLEFVLLEQLDLIYPHLDYFFEHLGAVKNDSSVRPLAHICEILMLRRYEKKDEKLKTLLTSEHKLALTTCCFDWLITHQKVACEVRAMTCLYFLGTEIDWIHSELMPIIESNIPIKSAGYRARGKKVLQMIQRKTT